MLKVNRTKTSERLTLVVDEMLDVCFTIVLFIIIYISKDNTLEIL